MVRAQDKDVSLLSESAARGTSSGRFDARRRDWAEPPGTARSPSARLARLREVFRPASPIDNAELVAGRARQIDQLVDALDEPGQHVVVYGERGVGKTSLLVAVHELLVEHGSTLVLRVTCDRTDTFSTIWSKLLADDVRRLVRSRGSQIHASDSVAAVDEPLPDGLTPDAVRSMLSVLTTVSPVALFIDEFDRVEDRATRTLFADTVKVLSDRCPLATVVLIGVADRAGDLLDATTVDRALMPLAVPRLPRPDLSDVVVQGFGLTDLEVDTQAVSAVVRLSHGLPYYTHLLCQLAGRSAIRQARDEVLLRDVDWALAAAIERAPEALAGLHQTALAGPDDERRSFNASLLVAAALASGLRLGPFDASDVVRVLASRSRPPDAAAVAARLDVLASPSRTTVLRKSGDGREPVYRFDNSLFAPYAVMRAVAEGEISLFSLARGD